MSSEKINKEKIEELKHQFNEELSKSSDVDSVMGVKTTYIGRKGELTTLLRSLGDLTIEEKKEFGPILNNLRNEMEEGINKKIDSFSSSGNENKVDLTKPGKKVKKGHLHPLTKVGDEVMDVFRSLNFSVVDGPEVESEFYNFDALNIPKDHPARDMWDTFWVKEEKSKKEDGRSLLRTHTSPMQIRYMKENKPPFQIIVPGRVFRYEATDASHEINFYQVEGLMVGENITLSNLKYVVEEFLKKIFDDSIEFRFRPSYFPFVEPGLEVDIKMKDGKDEWLEILGAGMVHPNVFESAGYDSEKIQGFAFGVGLDRIAMIKYGIPDIRLFYSGDLRFIKQF
ncbi:MAG: phenylalanine--tRNA ligase subunit alpha [Candidatus Paceibacterota bacterium]